jgi:hypothetical protein
LRRIKMDLLYILNIILSWTGLVLIAVGLVPWILLAIWARSLGASKLRQLKVTYQLPVILCFCTGWILGPISLIFGWVWVSDYWAARQMDLWLTTLAPAQRAAPTNDFGPQSQIRGSFAVFCCIGEPSGTQLEDSIFSVRKEPHVIDSS